MSRIIPATAAALAATLTFNGFVEAGSIPGGDDIWATPCGGGCYAAFSGTPIPADFFAPGSEPFTGTIYFGGSPVALSQPTVPIPSDVDTIVRRGATSPRSGARS